MGFRLRFAIFRSVAVLLNILAVLRIEEGVFVNTAIERASADKDIAALKAFQKRKEHRLVSALGSKTL